MIDHKSFTDAYNKHSKGMLYLARKLYRLDPDGLAAETWTRLWTIRDRITTIEPRLLRVIMSGLVKTYWRKATAERRRLERYTHTPKSEREDRELPQIVPDDLSEADQAIYRRLLSYSRSRQTLRDTGIPRSTLHDFRSRMRKRFPEKIG